MKSKNENREVDFESYCQKCQYRFYPEEKHPCNECLATPMNKESCKPVNWVGEDLYGKKYIPELSKEEQKYLDAIGNVFEV